MKSWCIDTDSLIVYIKTKDIYSDFAKDLATRFDTDNYELCRTLKNKKSNWINERWIKWENNDRVCCIGTKNDYLKGNGRVKKSVS